MASQSVQPLTVSNVRKALVAVTGAAIAIAAGLGIVIDSDAVAAGVSAVTAVLVFVVPND